MIHLLKKKLKEPVARYSNLKYIEWEPSDFTKHGYIATYALGKCRCVKCKKRWLDWGNELNRVPGPKPRRNHGDI
jgi:hypothetical protein|tara:strand:- start:350 stop:574 length:225 start_codon:yes stop_codon:yes gene_type:complete